MKLIDTPLPDAKVIEPQVFGDERGWFFEAWSEAKLKDLGLDLTFCQDNRSMSVEGVLRGLHYQWPNPQGKLVSCTQGAIWDVAVDLREDSPTFRQWYGLELNDENKLSYWIPEGFAHGFVVLRGPAVVSYKVTTPFSQADDTGIQWNDPDVGVEWPLPAQPILSAKDKNLPFRKDQDRIPNL
jgi:dTDP-4-dehydrorhamnose 3,5-epimerase